MKKQKNKWSTDNIKEIIEFFAIATGHNLVSLTKNLDSALPSASKELALWMDTINGHPGGWFHRVKHGHDFVVNLPEVFKKFGAEGVAKYPYELFKDASTKHGIPLPGTQFLVNSNFIGAKGATEWLSLNLGDVFTGGLAIVSTYKLYKKKKDKKNLNSKDVIFATIGIGVKIGGGVATTNPILILSGIADTAILITDFEEAKKAFKEFLNWDLIIKGSAAGITATAAGAASAMGSMSAVAAFGTASTGTAISTLSGAAATNATLAAIGGGSLASGGLGIVGGMAILGCSGVFVAGLVGYGVYQYLRVKNLTLNT